MSSKSLSLCLALCLGACHATALADHPTIAFGGEGGGAINTISTETPPAGSWGVGLRSEYISNDAFSTTQLEDYADSGLEGVHSVDSITNTSLSLFYSVNENLGISARLPYIERKNIREGELEDGEPEAHTHGDSSGAGDLLLLAQYRVLASGDTNASLLFGVKAPTGETGETDDDGIRFETEFQPGTGSWDYLLGASISKTVGKFGYHANILYNLTTEGSQATEIGDAFNYNAALTWRLGEDHAAHGHDHHHDAGHSELAWDLSVELNGETRQKNKVAGASEENSGGTTIYLSPGARVSAGSFSGFISCGVPIVENQNGVQTDVSGRLVAGISLAM